MYLYADRRVRSGDVMAVAGGILPRESGRCMEDRDQDGEA